MQWRDIRRLWLCFEVLAVLRWTFVLDILEIRLTVASALKHDFGGCLQTIFWEEVAFYSRSIQPPESGALSGCCSQHGPGQEGSTQDKAVSTAALRVGMLWNTAVFRTEVLLMRHQRGCMAPGSSFMSIDAAHLACADSRNFSGVEFSKQFSSLRNDFFFLQCSSRTKGFIYRSLLSIDSMKTSFESLHWNANSLYRKWICERLDW